MSMSEWIKNLCIFVAFFIRDFILSFFTRCKGEESYFALIQNIGPSLIVTVVDAKTEEIVCNLSFIVHVKFKSTKEFVQNLSKTFNKTFKAVILNIFDYSDHDYPDNYKLCKLFKDYFDSVGIPYCFISSHQWFYSSLLLAADVTVDIGDKILCVIIGNDYYQVEGFEFTDTGYRQICLRNVSANQNSYQIKEQILGIEGPVEIIALPADPDVPWKKMLRKMKFNDDIFTFVHTYQLLNRLEVITELSTSLLRKEYVRFFVLPKCIRKYALIGTFNDKIVSMAAADINCQLPLKSTRITPKSNVEYSLYYKSDDFDNTVVLSKFTLPENCHRNKLTFYVDINNFPFYELRSILYKNIQNLPRYLNRTVKSKIPVIAFGHNFSVICLYDQNENGYDFAQRWNGMYGQELFISFYEEKQKYGQAAAEDYLRNPSYVVFDLLKIISMPTSNTKTKNSWKFNIINDIKNQVIIEFDNFDGDQKLATPTFLLAMILKQHKKVIKAETGEKPDEFAFWFLNNKNDEKIKRIKQGFENACDMVRLKCHFV